MVRLRRRGSGRGLCGKLTGDPAVEAAAVAITLGVDPGFVLDADDRDLPLVQAVLRRGQELRVEYDDSLAEAIGAQTASKLLPPMTRHLTRLVNALARAMSH